MEIKMKETEKLNSFSRSIFSLHTRTVAKQRLFYGSKDRIAYNFQITSI